MYIGRVSTMIVVFKVCVCFLVCQLYLSAHGSAIPVEELRQARANSGENDESEYQAGNENSHERQLQESQQSQSKQQAKKQLDKSPQEQSQEQQSRRNKESNEQSGSQQEESQETLDQEGDSQERNQVRRDNSQEEDEEEEEEVEEKRDQTRRQPQQPETEEGSVPIADDKETKVEDDEVQEEEYKTQPHQHQQQKQQQQQQKQKQTLSESRQDEQENATQEQNREQQTSTQEKDDQQEKQQQQHQQQKEPLPESKQDEQENVTLEQNTEQQNSTQEKDDQQQTIQTELQGPSESLKENESKQKNDDPILDDFQTEKQEQQPILQDHEVDELKQEKEDQETQEKPSAQELQQNTTEQQSELQRVQQNRTLQQTQNDLHGQPSKQQHQYLPQPVDSQDFRRQPDVEVETQIPPSRNSDLESSETKGHAQSAVLQPDNKSDTGIQPEATTDDQNVTELNFMITRMVHPNITRPYAMRRVNFSRNVIGTKTEDESRTLLTAALGLLTGLNMGANNVGYDMPSTGKFTASNTMSFLGKIFNTDFSISYGSPMASHVPTLYPHTQVVYSPPLPVDHRSPVSYSPPLSIGHSHYYDRQEPHKQDEYIPFPPYGKPHPDNANWPRKPEFATSTIPHQEFQQLGKLQEQQFQIQNQLQQHQLQQQLQDQPSLQLQEPTTQVFQQHEQHQLQQQLHGHEQQTQQQEHYQLQQLHLQELERQEQHVLLQQQHEPHEQLQQQQHVLLHEQHEPHEQLQQQHEQNHQHPEFFTSTLPLQDYSRYETTDVDDLKNVESSGQPEEGTTEMPSYSKSDEKTDSDVKPEVQDSSKDDDDDKSLPHDSGEVSIDSYEYLDEGSFSEEDIIRKKKEKKKRQRQRQRQKERNKSSHRHRHRHHSRSEAASSRSSGDRYEVNSNESNVGSEDTRYRSSEESRERRD